MSSVLLWPIRSDASPLYTPTFDGGAWPAALPAENLQDERLHYPARSATAYLPDTRVRCDLKVDRAIRGVAIPKSNLSTAGKFRVLGVPSTMLFDYEAGEDIADLGGTFSRAPTAGVRAATYVDQDGVLQHAGENRILWSEEFDDAAWTASNVTVDDQAVAGPFGDTTADELAASAGNGTVRQGVTTVAATYTFSVWLKRKTGTGDVDISVDGTTWSTVAVTNDWRRFTVSQTGVAGTSNPGVRIVTSGDAVYAWGAQLELGSSAKAYLATTTAAVGAIRDGHFPAIDGERSLLLEAGSTNLVTDATDLSTWSTNGTPTVTGSQADPFGGTDAWLIEDDDGGTSEYVHTTVAFTGDGAKAVAVFIKPGTAAQSFVGLYNNTGGAYVLSGTITWSAGDPGTPSMGQGVFLGKVQLANGWWRLLFQTDSLTAANTHHLRLLATAATAAQTGTTYYAFPQAEDRLSPTSLIPTTGSTVARTADSLYFTFSAVPQEMTGYAKFTELGSSLDSGARIFHIGLTDGSTDPRLFVLAAATGYRLNHDNGTTTASATLAALPSIGEKTELRPVLDSDGSVLIGQSIESAAETTDEDATTATLQAAWAGTRLYVNGNPAGTNLGAVAIHALRFQASTNTMAAMRALVHDSGWLDAWPSGIDEEEAEGMNLPLLELLASDFTARYWSVQVSDEANADGAVDLSRLVVGAGYEPTKTFAYGAEIMIDTETRVRRTKAGSVFVDEQPRWREVTIDFRAIPEGEAMESHLDFVRRVGIHGQFFFVWDKADTTHQWRRSWLARLKKTSALRAAYLRTADSSLRFATTYDVVEVL